MQDQNEHVSLIRGSYRLIIVICALLVVVSIGSIYFFAEPETELGDVPKETNDIDRIENGIHVRTGLIEAPGLMQVVNNCTSCHTAEIVIQNRMDEEAWKANIRWMQETQNLWDLGENEKIIVDYLVKNYPYKSKGRRAILTNVEWYELKD